MGTAYYSALKDGQLDLALERLEMLLDPENQKLLQGLDARKAAHLPELSESFSKSPHQLKKKLDRLKAAGFVYSSKRYPKGYSLNQLKCVKVKLQAGLVIKSL